MKPDLSRRLAAEALGTLFLLAAVVGSGIMAEQLSNGNTAVALLANTFATSGILVILILSFGPLSAHFNPAVSLVMAFRADLPWREFSLYVLGQFLGAFAGVLLAHVMFELPPFTFSVHDRHDFFTDWPEFIQLDVNTGLRRQEMLFLEFRGID